MVHLLKSKHNIRLVYSAEEKSEASRDQSETVEELWGQLDLFSTEKPDTVIFAYPEDLGFEGIVNILVTGHARRIFDFREMPFISFDNEPRESFLRVLSSNKVDYFNKFNLKKELGNSDQDNLEMNVEHIKSFFQPLIEKGPTVIFSNEPPNEDKFVYKFLKLLTEAKIPHSTVLAQG